MDRGGDEREAEVIQTAGATGSYPQEPSESDAHYLQGDIIVNLRASLIAVLANALARSEATPDFLKGVIALARSQAALYDIPWSQLVSELGRRPELRHLVRGLRDSSLGP
jgi:hypothetical protein